MAKFLRTNKTAFKTGLNANTNYRVECSVKLLDVGETQDTDIFGANYIYDPYKAGNTFSLRYVPSRNNFTYYCHGIYNDWAGAYAFDTLYHIIYCNQYFDLNGTRTNINAGGSYSSWSNIAIGGVQIFSYYEYGVDCKGSFDWEYFKVYDGDTLIRHYVPAIDDNNLVCFKDLVNNTYLYAEDQSKVEIISTFDIDKTNISHNQFAFTDTVNVECDSTASWTASTSNSWITLSKSAGTGNDTVNISVAKNNKARTGTVVFTSEGESITLTINQRLDIPIHNVYKGATEEKKLYKNGLVKQTFKGSDMRHKYFCNIYLLVNKSQIKIHTSKSNTFNISTNTKWNITCNSDKILLSSYSGTGDSVITLTASSSWTSGDEATVFITNELISKEINIIYQENGPNPNEFWYKTVNNELLNLNGSFFKDAVGGNGLSIVSNVYNSELECFVVTLSGNIVQVTSSWDHPAGTIGYKNIITWARFPEGVVNLCTVFDNVRNSNSNYYYTAILPSTITKIEGECFYESYAKKIICYATVPPEINDDDYRSLDFTLLSDGIYVPAESVDAYKAASKWSTWYYKIYPITD